MKGLDSGCKTTVFLLASVFKIMESSYDLLSDAESRDTVEKPSVPVPTSLSSAQPDDLVSKDLFL